MIRKRIHTSYRYFTIVPAICVMMASCKKDKQEADYNANKQELKRLTDSVTQVYAQASEGRDIGEYPKQARADLKKAVDMAASVNNGQFTQQEVNNAYASLRRAISAFNARQIAEVASQNLIAKWLFNGNAQDATSNHNDGTLMSGIIGTEGNHTDGGTLPVLTTDRFGKNNSAYEFANGAYIEVPYKTGLNPDMLSISMWIKPKEQFGDNYIMSLNRWNGFKFQLQADNFLFMTLKTPAATFDKDSNPGKMVIGEWHHAVVTVGNGAITFYVDGAQVKTESLAGTAAKLAVPVNLAIGQQLPKDQFNFTDTNNPNYFYSGSYFKGALDDIRYYNKVLTTTEVTSIYNNEKPD